MSFDPPAQEPAREYTVRPYNRRMARRVARRAHIDGEEAIAVAFTFNNLATMMILSGVEDFARYAPVVGPVLDLALSVVGFYFHRIVLVTDQSVYVFRDWPFHIPGRLLLKHRRGPRLVQLGSPDSGTIMRFIRRGQLTFQEGTIVYHSPIYIRRARYIAQEANLAPGQ